MAEFIGGARYMGAMAQVSDRISSWLVANRVLLIVIFGMLTVFLGYRASLLHMDPGFDKSIPLKQPYMETFQQYRETFGSGNNIVLALMRKDGDIFTPEYLKTLEAATRDVIYTPGVDRAWVKSLFTPNVFFIGINEEGFYAGRIVPSDFKPTEQGIAEVRSNLLQSKEVGRLVSKDYRGALISTLLVERDPDTGEKLDYVKFAAQLEDIRARYSNDDVSVHIIGFAKFIGDVIVGALDVVLFFAITLAITAVLLYFFSGSLQITVLALAVALVAVVWQLGLVELAGYGLDPMSILVPFLILSIGISHAVQMTNAWRLEVTKGKDSVEAAKEAFNKLFIPGTTALLANAVGFGVIMLIDIAIIHELGITASIGVAVMVVTNKFLLPALLCYARVNPQTQIREEGDPPVARHWQMLSGAAQRSYWTFVAIAVIGGLAFWGSRGLIVGDSSAGAPEFYEDSVYNRDIAVINANFNVAIDEFMVVAETKEMGCVDYGVLRTLDDFDWEISQVKGVKSVQTLSKIVKERMMGNSEGSWKFYAVPRSRYSIGNTIADRSMNVNQQFFSYDCKTVPLRIYTADHQAATLNRVAMAVERFAAGHDGDDVRFRLASGNAGVMQATNKAVEAAESRMNITLFLAVGLFCYLTFVSLRAVACIVIPLALVAYFANAMMAWLGIGLKVSTLPVVALGVGVGVDYGIYLFARAYSYMTQGMALRAAYARALSEVGSAIVFTALTMSIGVATWAFASLKFQADMGLLLAYMFFVNMIGAVLLLPALAAWFYPEHKNSLAAG